MSGYPESDAHAPGKNKKNKKKLLKIGFTIYSSLRFSNTSRKYLKTQRTAKFIATDINHFLIDNNLSFQFYKNRQSEKPFIL